MTRRSLFCWFTLLSRRCLRTGNCLLLLLLPLGASYGHVAGPSDLPALRTALAPDGTLRPGLRGSFAAQGYTLGTTVKGRLAFRSSRLRRPTGTGDERWRSGFIPSNAPNAAVRVLAVDGSNVYLGGDFTAIGSLAASHVAKWNGATWSALGTGLSDGVNALAVDGSGAVYAGGIFTQAGSVTANRIAKWNGTAWSALAEGLTSDVNALALVGTSVYAGGSFTQAGSVAANRVAKWNGTTWSALGAGLDNSVLALAVDGSGTVYAGGSFTQAGSVAANRVAKWNGTTWSALGAGLNDGVDALALVGTSVYAGGSFTQAGSVAANRVAKWNGTAWSALGTGLDNTVLALAVDGSGTVYAGGDFIQAGSASANHVATWNGTAWSTLGTGLNSDVSALATAGSTVYAGGPFTTVGDGSKATNCFGVYGSGPLPVTLVAFTALAQGAAAVQVTWRTASETNSAYFDVERSVDGQAFGRLRSVAAAGSSSLARTYSVLDSQVPASVRTLYYRLRQVDLDGSFRYSPVRAVSLAGQPARVALFPNPTTDTATLLGAAPGTCVRVVDALGRLVATATADATGTAQVVLPADLPRGVYVVHTDKLASQLVVE